MLKETMKKFYDKKYDLNCAECMLMAANEEYDLNLQKETIKAMSAFGGGMAVGSVCGAITGSIAALGIMFTEERGHKSPHVKMMTTEFINKFKSKLEEIDCIPLKKLYFENIDDRCIKMMEVAADTLEEVVLDGNKKYKIYSQ